MLTIRIDVAMQPRDGSPPHLKAHHHDQRTPARSPEQAASAVDTGGSITGHGDGFQVTLHY